LPFEFVFENSLGRFCALSLWHPTTHQVPPPPVRKGRPTKPGQNLGSLNFCSSLVAGNADNISCVSAAAVGSCNCWLFLSLRPLFLAPSIFHFPPNRRQFYFCCFMSTQIEKWCIILSSQLGIGGINNGVRSPENYYRSNHSQCS